MYADSTCKHRDLLREYYLMPSSSSSSSSRYVGCDNKFQHVLWGKVTVANKNEDHDLGKLPIRDILCVRKGTTTTHFKHLKRDADIYEVRCKRGWGAAPPLMTRLAPSLATTVLRSH